MLRAQGQRPPPRHRYDESMARYAAAAVSTQQSLSYLNLGQSLIFTGGLTAAMVITAQQVRHVRRAAGTFGACQNSSTCIESRSVCPCFVASLLRHCFLASLLH
jgi:ABC-type transport system involved in Fe-S cluster assembly fused permease/ATPase subunit